jgi:uncharacterized membrane protein
MTVVDDHRIEDLERVARSLTVRVHRLERQMGTDCELSPPGQEEGEPLSAGPRTAEPLPARPRATEPLAAEPRAAEPRATGPESPPARPSAPGRPKDSHQRLEDLLGGRMLAWLGGVAVVVGIALFLVYAVAHGWIGETARVLGAAAGSFALIGLGVWLHEHRGRTDAAWTLVGAGVAGLFISDLVASRLYAVIPVGLGFALALATGVLAASLAVRWRAKVIAAIGIIGALLAPVLVGAPSDLATLLILSAAAASAVAVLLWCRWDWLGFAVVLVCAPQWLSWLSTAPSVIAVLCVLVVFGALGHLAAIGFELRVSKSPLRAPSTFLFALNAATLAIAGRGALADLGHPVAANLWIAGLGVAHLLMAVVAGRVPRVSADIRLLLLTLGVLLGDVAFALLADGPLLAVGWAASGVLFAWLLSHGKHTAHSRVMTELGLGGHSAIALLVAVSQATPLDFPDLADQVGATIALAAAAGGMFTSARLTAGSSLPWRPLLNALGLSVVAYVTAINIQGAGLVIAWATEAAALAGIARRTGEKVAAYGSLAFLAAAAAHILAVEAPPQALTLGVPSLSAAAVAIGTWAASCTLIARARLTVDGQQIAAVLLGVAAVAVLYLASAMIITVFQPIPTGGTDVSLPLAVRQQGQLVLSALWGVSGVSAVILGLRRNLRLVRLGALALLLVTAAKVFFYDLSTLESVYRIASFIVLGVLLLAGAYAYQRLRPSPPPDLRSVPRALR